MWEQGFDLEHKARTLEINAFGAFLRFKRRQHSLRRKWNTS